MASKAAWNAADCIRTHAAPQVQSVSAHVPCVGHALAHAVCAPISALMFTTLTCVAQAPMAAVEPATVHAELHPAGLSIRRAQTRAIGSMAGASLEEEASGLEEEPPHPTRTASMRIEIGVEDVIRGLSHGHDAGTRARGAAGAVRACGTTRRGFRVSEPRGGG